MGSHDVNVAVFGFADRGSPELYELKRRKTKNNSVNAGKVSRVDFVVKMSKQVSSTKSVNKYH